jgi:cobalt-zinc-cadmium efflux system protein
VSPSPERRLLIALVLTATFMVVEAVAGWLVHSLALLSDAGHMLADAGALALALTAQRVASRPRTLSRTYGYRRAETLAALANGVVLCLTALWVIAEAIARWQVPGSIDALPMLAVALLGLLFNLVAGLVLSTGHVHNANTRAAVAHVVSDALGSLAAIVAAVLVLAFGWQRADAVASVAISVLILLGAFRLVSETVSVLMESVPSGVVLEDLERTIRGTAGVADMHDLHAWTISDGFDAVTVHVVLDGTAHGTDVARDVGERVQRIHSVAHVTVQPEAPPFSPALHPAQNLLRNRKP